MTPATSLEIPPDDAWEGVEEAEDPADIDDAVDDAQIPVEFPHFWPFEDVNFYYLRWRRGEKRETYTMLLDHR